MALINNLIINIYYYIFAYLLYVNQNQHTHYKHYMFGSFLYVLKATFCTFFRVDCTDFGTDCTDYENFCTI